MTRRQALIAAAAAIPGAILAAEQPTMYSTPLTIAEQEPLEVRFKKDCFSTLTFETASGEIVVKWSDVIDALR